MARFTITVPAKSARSKSRSPQYVSSNTKSASVSVNGGTATAVQLTAGSPNCTSSDSGLQCGITVSAPVGNDTFLISLYASTDGTGTPLATQSIAAAVSQNQTTPVNITLDGVVASLAIALSNTSPTEGTAADLTLTVNAQDASGATIVSPGSYSTAITLADDDTSGATSLSATQVTSPSANTVTVHYTGAHVVAHFSASAQGVNSVSATLQSVAAPTPTPSPTPTPPLGQQSTELLWIANTGGHSVLAMDTTAILTGQMSAAPSIAISGANTQFSTYAPQCVQEDSTGGLYVVGSQGSKLAGAIVYFSNGGLSGGNLTPGAVITGNNTLLTNPVGCAFDSSGNLWIANDDDFTDSVVMFSAAQLTSGGNVAPARIIHPITCCGNSSLCNTVSLTFDPSGDLWTGSLCAPTAEFAASDIATSGSPTPILYFGQAAGVSALRFDSFGNLWTVLGSPVAEITEYYASSLVTVAPAKRQRMAALGGADVTITSPMLFNPYGLDFDSNGNLWVIDQTFNILFMLAKRDISAGGPVTPSAIINGPTTSFSGPTNMQFFALPRILAARHRST